MFSCNNQNIMCYLDSLAALYLSSDSSGVTFVKYDSQQFSVILIIHYMI